MVVSIHIEESQFQFAKSDYEDWCKGEWSVGDGGKFDKLFQKIGFLNRGKDVYENQAKIKQNFAEVKYAEYLIQNLEFPPTGVFFENYALAQTVIAENSSGIGPKAIGAKAVADVLSDQFQAGFERLYHINQHKLINDRGGIQTLEGAFVNLCAIDSLRRRFWLTNVKRYHTENERSGKAYPHQLFVLAAASYLFMSLGNKAFKDYATYSWTCRWVTAVADDAIEVIPSVGTRFLLELC